MQSENHVLYCGLKLEVNRLKSKKGVPLPGSAFAQ